MKPTAKTLSDLVYFDCPFEIHPDGTLSRPDGVYGPDIYHSETDDYTDAAPWYPETGWSGQCLYPGPVMHASEYLGGAMARHVLETPGIWVVTAVECLSDDDDDDYPEPAGWMLLHLDEGD